ncbi:divergent polysaccharide deacetylase family protein [Glaciecola siphonariae]|uniref:Divergent polysaccharide deacetylase family protein n=1 Tax=Glaciecola siphonariae TaxID=521012 RepID=A0ABV9LY97_9ALTE
MAMLTVFACANASERSTSKIAIIIDDIGAKAADKYAFELPRSVTFSILPHTRYSTPFSFTAAQQNREVMLHMPMESLNGEALGEGPLLSSMYPQELENALHAALSTVPHAVGVNNHMGSKLTQMTLPMQTVMRSLTQSNMFFIDSRTTKFTKAGSIAKEFGLSSATRHVFLDHERNTAFIDKQFEKLIKRARRNGKAIGIAHPHKVSVTYLKEALAKLPDDIEVVTISEYLRETDKFRINPMLVQSNHAIDNDKPNQTTVSTALAISNAEPQSSAPK